MFQQLATLIATQASASDRTKGHTNPIFVKEGFAVTLFRTARNSLILKRPGRKRAQRVERPAVSERSESNGEMSEWLKEHAWKSKLASDTKPLRSGFNTHEISDLTFQNYRPVCVRKPRCFSRF